jgi:urease accessory protein
MQAAMPRRSSPGTSITPITIMGMTTGIITIMAEDALYDLMTWMSPMWPLGAFAHSSGLEWAVEAGHVTDRETTRQWIADLIGHGPVHNDMVLFVHGWRAITRGAPERLAELAELSLATQTGLERRVEATAQGAAFRKIAISTSGKTAFDPIAHITDDELTYPIVVACLTAARAIPLRQALTAFAHGVVANLVSAAQRLVPLGQTDGQLVLHELRPVIMEAITDLEQLPEGDPFDQIGGATLVAEIGCMAHETQYTRLFRT